LIGVASGLAAAAFTLLLQLFEELFVNRFLGLSLPKPAGEGGGLDYEFKPSESYWLIPVSTAVGGLISGLLIYSLAPEAEGHGTDAAIYAYHYKQGRVKPAVVPVKLLASAITIGSGGSAGSEGPTIQFSGGLGSLIAELFRLSPEDRRIALAVGMAAGLGSIFKTPLGGALLAAEVLYKRDVEVAVIYPALVASAVGYTVYSSIFGFTPIFGFNSVAFNPAELPLYALLGLATGLAAILYVKVFYGVHELFAKAGMPRFLKPAVGGALAGLIALIAPEVLGVGYGWVDLAMRKGYTILYSPLIPPLILLFLLPFLKMLATAFTVASGGSGGVFAPGLFIGAYIGASLGTLFKYLLPNITSSTSSFIIVGMASFFAAAGKTPLAMIVMTAELTGDLQILPAAMVAVAVSYMVSGESSIYRSQVATRSESPAHKPS